MYGEDVYARMYQGSYRSANSFDELIENELESWGHELDFSNIREDVNSTSLNLRCLHLILIILETKPLAWRLTSPYSSIRNVTPAQIEQLKNVLHKEYAECYVSAKKWNKTRQALKFKF